MSEAAPAKSSGKETQKRRKAAKPKNKKKEITQMTLEKLSTYEWGQVDEKKPPFPVLNLSGDSEDDGKLPEEKVVKSGEKTSARKNVLEKLNEKLLPVREGPSHEETVRRVGIRQSHKEKLMHK